MGSETSQAVPAAPRNDRPPRVGVLGWAMSSVGRHPGSGHLDLLLDAVRGAVTDAGLGFGDVEGLYVVPDDFGARDAPMLAARLPEALGRTLALVELGGTTAALALKTALQDLRLGQAPVAVVAAGSKTAAGGLRGDPYIFSDPLLFSQGSMIGPWLLPYATADACRGRRVRWADLSGCGRLHGFTQLERAFFFTKPDVIGLVLHQFRPDESA